MKLTNPASREYQIMNINLKTYNKILKRSIYASKKTESQVDMKEAKRMTLFNIMINVSRNGIKAIMKNDPIKYLQKTRRTCGLQNPLPSLTKPMRQLKSACTTGPKQHFLESTFNKYKSDIRNTWKTINRIMSRNKKGNCYPSSISIDGIEITNQTDMANTFNTFFYQGRRKTS